MANQLSTKIPWWFWFVAILALLWNFMGVGAFISDVTMTDEALQALPDAQRELYENNPMWTKIVYGIAVFGGLLGSIGLLAKKKWAKPIFVVSLIAIFIQMGYSLFIAKTPEAYGSVAYIMPVLVILIAAFLIAFSNRAIKRGWLT
ncbi:MULTISPECIES: hypothetical protein [Galbibacter]|uniref:Sugar transporter n=1 Tax=Galbibacter pacificus TaxID=2996052 RepID=A0ABT6FVV7_9FLAO|nr:hypothetical protein [Galbibacter pacificus]MDG3583683.1 hypothetical protein [Galbibacter pacificus]MDG3587399.1 hypothetical protein [Galbibacter pacificus]